MEFFRIHRTIPFMRYALVLNAISLITFLVAAGFLLLRGLNLSIEFTGGTVMEVAFHEAADLGKIRAAIETKGWGEFQVQNFGTSRDVLIRLPTRPEFASGQQAELVMAALTADPAPGEDPACRELHAARAALAPLSSEVRAQRTDLTDRIATLQAQLAGKCSELRRVEVIGPAVGQELAQDGTLALICVCLGIMAYLALRFEWKFSIAAIVANMHDVFLVVGMFSIFRWEFSLPVLAAVLAVLGYSVNESVIIFDRVREHFKKFRKMSTVEVIDSAITATISRTIITHGCTLAMTLSMLIFGGPALHYFALALTIGICFGIYSSVFVAAAIAMYLGVKREDLIRAPKKEDATVV